MRLLLAVGREFFGRGCHTHAAAMAFHASFALFPLLLASAILLSSTEWGNVLYQRWLILAEANLALDRSILPDGALQPPPGGGPALLLAAAALLWSALQIVSAARRGLAAAWQLEDMPVVVGIGTALKGVLALLGLAALAGLMISLIELPRIVLAGLMGWDELIGFFDNWVYRGLFELLSIAMGFAASWALYQILAGKRSTVRNSIPGAVFCAIAIPILKIGFWAYFSVFVQFDLIYGSIASFLAVLIWIYLAALVFLVGGVICEQIHARCGQGLPNP